MTPSSDETRDITLQMPLLAIPKLENGRALDAQTAVTDVESNHDSHAQVVADLGSPPKKVKLLVRGVHFA